MSDLINKLDAARQSVWDAIDHWEPLLKSFKTKRRYNAPVRNFPRQPLAMGDPSAPLEFPAIVIFPDNVSWRWDVNKLQRVTYTLRIILSLSQPYATNAEWLLGEVVNALWRSKPVDDPRTFIKRTTGYEPDVKPFAFTPGNLDSENDNQSEAIRITGGVSVEFQYQPQQ